MAKQKYTKRADGRYMTSVWDGTYIGGKKHRVQLYSTVSSKDLEKKVAEFEKLRDEGAITREFKGSAYDYIMMQIDMMEIEESTKRGYKSYARHMETLKYVSLDCITRSTIQMVMSGIESDCVKRLCFVVLKKCLRLAEADHFVRRGTTEEVTRGIKCKYSSKECRRHLTDEEKASIPLADLPLKEKALLYTLYCTGMRREEIMALTPFDVNLRKKTISVNKAIGNSSKGGYVKGTKSAHGVRTIPMPDVLCDILAEYIPTVTGEYLFTTSTASFARNYSVMVNTIVEAMKKAYLEQIWKKKTEPNWSEVGFVDLTGHYFRHNFCTMLCYQQMLNHNISTKKIAELLGDSEEMVIKVYSHIVDDMERPEEAISNAIGF